MMRYILYILVVLTLVMCKTETKTEIKEEVKVSKDQPEMTASKTSTSNDVGNVEGEAYTDSAGKVYHILQEIIDGNESVTLSYDEEFIQMVQSIRWKGGAEYVSKDHKLFMDKGKTKLFIKGQELNLTKK